MTTGGTKILVYPPGPVAPNSPIQSAIIESGDRIEWNYTSSGGVNFVYGYVLNKPAKMDMADDKKVAAQ